MGKLCHQSFPLSKKRNVGVLDLLFMDVWGPSPHLSSEGNRITCLLLMITVVSYDTGWDYIAKHVKFHESTFPLSKPSLLGAPPIPVQSPIPYSTAPVRIVREPSLPFVSAAPAVQPAPVPNSPLPPDPCTLPLGSPISQISSESTPRSNIRRPDFYDPSAYLNELHALVEPTCFPQENRCPLWRAAMRDEIDAMIRTNTWTLVPQLPSMHVIRCRRIYKLKNDAQGKVTRRRACLVAKGNHQHEGIDYFDTFIPVVKHTTVRLMLRLAITFRWPLRQIDIQNAFLHGDLDETVYMQQLIGDSSLVCKLNKSLYGIKQAPRAWFHCLHKFLGTYGFVPSQADPSLFICHRDGVRLFMLVYVDDIIVTGSSFVAV
ncbi:transmembrane signal receptor [Lithospermum erythrorhizon]|uniref:Transmembrane signal receptor n=1 Tax=Lithospermum erythrorhizon TaxID=34254 RepID=A0AAV3PFX7_LITER